MEETFSQIDEESSGWANEFMKIQTNCFEFNYTTLEAKKPDSKKRNRYRDVLPYDHSRVKLDAGKNDYINASHVQGKKASKKYILTQGPKDNTVGHFWQMVWEQDCKVIVMLNKVIEKGVLKCAQYFPLGSEDNRTMVFDTNYKVQLIDEEVSSFFTIRTMKLDHIPTGASKQVLHFHYTKWPDFGVPQSPAAFLCFLAAVRDKGGMNINDSPPVVHCSAGVGRSGSFCLVDTCLAIIEKDGDFNDVDVMSILLDMRRDRMGLIQTPAQLRFSYLAVLEGAHAVLEHIPLSTLVEKDDLPTNPPPVPPRQTKRPHSPDDTDIGAGGNASVVRKRLRDEKNQALKDKVERMKDKQRKSEKKKKDKSILKKESRVVAKK
ncbi:tyrosine-protein phosphatase non-receptor type 1-like isoform X2 [Antedon mediterranea]|uniref:tyrosine-protein phosphatase non-receptor type 1-like isoform X2 n=1 Tax=Antedon mediterranea TaxID=105859 RepID=UPI003AF79B5F